MENLDSVWQISFIALVAGALIGALAYRLFAPSLKQAGKIKTELGEAREELSNFKASVNQHFNKTSELVNDLTQNYVKVYQHLAAGAQTLADGKNFTNLLEQHRGRVSIAIEDQTRVTNKDADDLLVDPAVKQLRPVKTVAEHTESFTDGTDTAKSEYGSAKTGASKSSGNLDDSAEAGEPVVNVDALEAVTKNAEIESRAEAVSAVPEGGEKPK